MKNDKCFYNLGAKAQGSAACEVQDWVAPFGEGHMFIHDDRKMKLRARAYQEIT